MPNSTTAVLAGIAVAVALAQAGPSAANADSDYTLRPQDCIDPGHVRNWQLLDESRVLVDAGRQHYLIELAAACPELGHNPFLGFISNNRLICGARGDRLVPHGAADGSRPQCDIRELQPISNEEQHRLLQQRPVQARFEQAP
jgi:hypothetical protein